jgi:hypothetical protein
MAGAGMDLMTLENWVILSMQHYPTVTLAIYYKSSHNRSSAAMALNSSATQYG